MEEQVKKTNVFRSEYKELSQDIKSHILNVKELAGELYDNYFIPVNISEQEITPTQGRAIALAKTKLEESVMWMTKALTE